MPEQENITQWSDHDLALEEHYIKTALPHLEKMVEANRRQLAAIEVEKTRRQGMAVAA